MMKVRSVRRFAGLLMLLAGLQSAPTFAQSPAPIPADAIRVPCCRCLDGSQQTVNINTRTAPWQVGWPGSTGIHPVVAAGNVSWYPVPPAGWVGPQGAPTAVGDYTYFIRIYVPRCTIPARVMLSGRFGADNTARVFLDATQIAVSQGTANYAFLQGGITPFSTPVGPGLHMLRVVVRNIGGPTGMILQGQLTFTCPRDLEQ